MSLIDRDLLKLDDDTVVAKKHAGAGLVRRPLEKKILKAFKEPGPATSVFTSSELQEETLEMEQSLIRVGLLPDEDTKRARRGRLVLAVSFLWAVALIKIVVALSRGRTNILYLILLAIAFAVGAFALSSPARTSRGEALLEDLRRLFSGLEERATSVQPGGATAEAALLAAVFGLAALPDWGYYARKLYRKAAPSGGGWSFNWNSACGASCGSWSAFSADSGGSSCGSSCGGGCGGGCGGCGVRDVTDRVGIGWRAELAAGILANLDRIDVVEVIADDLFDAPRLLRALRTLATQVPVVVHGVGLGLASCAPVEERRLTKMARVVDALVPDFWSEHLAFVRGGGVEIGHLAAPPRTVFTVEGTARNLERARAVVGAAPRVENVATLIDPPGSDRDEATWVAETLRTSGTKLLLDLHNLHANAVNFGFDALAFLDRIPVERVAAVHLAGGRWIGVPGQPAAERLLDDHLHDVPDSVYALLTEVGRRAPQPLTVILERDGAYPPMGRLLWELDRARAALRQGRRRERVGARVA